MLGHNPNRSHLVDQAREETLAMMEKAQEVFGIAWETLTEGKDPGRLTKLDQDINAGERLVRRLVIEHLTLNPTQDLPYSLTLVSIIHDVERLGDYAKSIVELSNWSENPLSEDGLGARCRELQRDIVPMFELSIEGVRNDDEAKATEVMKRHRDIKSRTDEITAEGLRGPQDTDEVLAVLVSRYLRRISAHLSNVVSSIVNPFDLIARNE